MYMYMYMYMCMCMYMYMCMWSSYSQHILIIYLIKNSIENIYVF